LGCDRHGFDRGCRLDVWSDSLAGESRLAVLPGPGAEQRGLTGNSVSALILRFAAKTARPLVALNSFRFAVDFGPFCRHFPRILEGCKLTSNFEPDSSDISDIR
jgi:hypothetical protein